jgi:hypothetical protein
MHVGNYSIFCADATRLPLADKSVDLVVGSPPYQDARTYGIAAQRNCQQWIDWMLDVTTEAMRVSKGPVIWVAAGVTRDRNYQPGCEGLMYLWWKRGGDCQLYRPVFWHRVGIPGSGGKDWFRADVEYCMCFKRPGELVWSDNTACGHKPKWAPGGEMSHRLSSGARVNQWGHPIDSGGTGGSVDDVTCGAARPSHFMVGPNRRADGQYKTSTREKVVRKAISRQHTKSRADGSDEIQNYTPPTKANPGNLLKTNVGGGLLGHPLAHDNEAPFPVALVEFFIKSLCPPGGTVYDPFCGSGTTGQSAIWNGRNAILSDLRQSQCELTRRRLKNPMMKRQKKLAKGVKVETLFGTEEAA